MAFTASTILQLVVLVTWTCLCDTPFNQKHTLFARYFTSKAVLEELGSTASIIFAPGLFEILKSAIPPTIHFFKSLPTDTSSRWAIYIIVLEKPGSRPRIYVGSGTSALLGVYQRFSQYDNGHMLPYYIEKALDEGYTIVHKGLLCWIPIPTAALLPVTRLLFVALEAAFAYMFWTMRERTRNHDMSHICLWDRTTLEYDGLCSHCSLNEGILGDFDLSPEQLEAQAIDKEQKRLELKAENATNYHYKQMEENYDEYIGKSSVRVARSRANNPGRDRQRQADRVEKARREKSFHCGRCNLTFRTRQILEKHEKSAKHRRKETEADNPFKCLPCNLGFHNQSNLTRHNQSETHRRNLEAAQSNQ